MPPKPKFSKEEIVAAALNLVRERGMEGLTARELGQRLGSSARPIFTVFSSMEEVQDAVRDAALTRFESYAQKVPHDIPAFMQLGLQMVLFAKEEPNLYLLRFLPENPVEGLREDLAARMQALANPCKEELQTLYGFSPESAESLFQHIWIYIFGVGTLSAIGVYKLTDSQFLEMLHRDFSSLMHIIQSAKAALPESRKKEHVL